MTVRVGFLRAVNLGKRRVEMARLKGVAEGLGYDDVWTYINSGNVVFDATGSPRHLEKDLEKALEDRVRLRVHDLRPDCGRAREDPGGNAVRRRAGDTHFVTFLKKAPSVSAAKAIEALSTDFDTLVVQGADVHWLMHGRRSRARWSGVTGRRSSGPSARPAATSRP